jgi:rhodanese-related sulfurtransferase
MRYPSTVYLTDPFDITELMPDLEKAIIVYCSASYHSAIVVHELNNFGINNASLPMANKGGTARNVHRYNEYWSQLLE